MLGQLSTAVYVLLEFINQLMLFSTACMWLVAEEYGASLQHHMPVGAVVCSLPQSQRHVLNLNTELG